MQDLNCNQVVALLAFFLDNKLNPKLMQEVEYHLNICSVCREKYLNLRKVLNNYQEIKDKIIQEEDDEDILTYKEKQYQVFKENLSAYVDNELDDEDNLRIRKISIANSDARQDLEDMLLFRELLKESFTKTADELKEDLSVSAVNKLYNRPSKQIKSKFKKYVPLIACVIFALLVCLVKIVF